MRLASFALLALSGAEEGELLERLLTATGTGLASGQDTELGFHSPVDGSVHASVTPLPDGRRLVFGALGPARDLLAEQDPGISVPAWLESYPIAPRVQQPLILTPLPRALFARGELRLRPGSGGRAATITRVASGCAMEHLFRVPIPLTDSGTSLAFEWDLHNSLDPSGAYVLLTLDGAPDVDLPIRLDPPPWRAGLPRRADLSAAGGEARLALGEETVDACARAVLRKWTDCVSVDRTGAAEWVVRETEKAGVLHACDSMQGYLELTRDPEPAWFRVELAHGPLKGRSGLRGMHGVFVAGETLALGTYRGEPRLIYLDRIPGAEAAFQSAGGALWERVTVPAELPVLEWLVERSEVAVEVRGPVRASWPAEAESWRRQ